MNLSEFKELIKPLLLETLDERLLMIPSGLSRRCRQTGEPRHKENAPFRTAYQPRRVDRRCRGRSADEEYRYEQPDWRPRIDHNRHA
jgi:hypothetical protein